MKRSASPAAVEIITRFEKCKLEAYDDGGGVWTIGYGHTGGVKPGDRINQHQAVMFLQEDMSDAVNDVNRLVVAPLSQSMFDALVSLVFNIGATNFAESTIRKLVNSRQYHQAAAEFGKWHKDNGDRLWGLSRRRAAEQVLFCTDDLPKESK
jgi:lysozyme